MRDLLSTMLYILSTACYRWSNCNRLRNVILNKYADLLATVEFIKSETADIDAMLERNSVSLSLSHQFD